MVNDQTNSGNTGNQDDATRIQNTQGSASSAGNNSAKSDATQINNSQGASTGSAQTNSGDATRIESNTAPPAQETNQHKQQQASQPASNTTNATENKQPIAATPKSGFSTGAFAAGVAGAAVAGTAAGAIFSDELRDAANQVAETAEGVFSGGEEAATAVANPDALFEMSGTDQEGNSFSVSLIDANHDGTIDSYAGTIDTVSGENITYAGQGNPFEMLNTPEMAGIEDFVNTPPDSFCMLPDFDMPDAEVYHIQAGDTLSEIALEHGTSVEEIMALNPDIQDPNLIYAGNELNLPDGSEIPNFNQPNEMPGAPSFAEEISMPDGAMDQIDWNDFENPQYAEDLQSSNFDEFSMPDSYEDSGYMEFDNDSTSADFLG